MEISSNIIRHIGWLVAVDCFFGSCTAIWNQNRCLLLRWTHSFRLTEMKITKLLNYFIEYNHGHIWCCISSADIAGRVCVRNFFHLSSMNISSLYLNKAIMAMLIKIELAKTKTIFMFIYLWYAKWRLESRTLFDNNDDGGNGHTDDFDFFLAAAVEQKSSNMSTKFIIIIIVNSSQYQQQQQHQPVFLHSPTSANQNWCIFVRKLPRLNY